MLRFLTAGESHGPSLMAILDGIPAGLPLDASIIDLELARRQKGYGSGGRMKIEKDTVQILGGVMGGVTTGGPIGLLVENRDHAGWKGRLISPMTSPRPGHADLTGAVKYGYRDLRPALERASARETAMRVAVGAVCKHFLANFGIQVGGYVTAIGRIKTDLDGIPYLERFERAERSEVRCPVESASTEMRLEIERTIRSKNTLGGIIEIAALNLPAGLGSFVQWDRRLEARLALALMSVQAIKGVEVGDAFANAQMPGTSVQDALAVAHGAGDLVRLTNRAGGIEGGISNGQPVVVRAAMKPIATTLSPQQTVDLASRQEAPTNYERSDFCPVPRAVPILEAMIAFVLADVLIDKLGGDSLAEMKPRFDLLHKTRLQDLPMDDEERVWWE